MLEEFHGTDSETPTMTMRSAMALTNTSISKRESRQAADASPSFLGVTHPLLIQCSIFFRP